MNYCCVPGPFFSCWYFFNLFNILWVLVILSKYIKSKPSINHHHLLTKHVNFPEKQVIGRLIWAMNKNVVITAPLVQQRSVRWSAVYSFVRKRALVLHLRHHCTCFLGAPSGSTESHLCIKAVRLIKAVSIFRGQINLLENPKLIYKRVKNKTPQVR